MKEKLATNWHLMNMIECRFNNLQLLRHCFISFSSLTYRRSSNSDDCFDSDSDSNTQHIREIIPIIITLIDYSINCISTGVGGLFRVSMKLSIVWFTSTAAWKDWNICAHSERRRIDSRTIQNWFSCTQKKNYNWKFVGGLN